ncbi:CBM-cenC domain-containing protein [Fusarium acuminatum]|uniref:CBM-cenC domain-containing protein n=1 Tax=Fusarium acuminatum TaxID=5515 RepID=A0ABZ2XAY8_9HYPO
MISKTFVTAFVATCLVAGSSASPCKVSSRTTEASTTAGASTTIASAETTALSVTATVSESSVETTLATTTAISSSKDSSIADSTTTEAESTVTSIESVATTTDGTTTVVATTTEAATTEAATTTTAEATSVPTFIANTGFEDSFDAVAAWSLYAPNSGVTLDLDTDVHHEGQNSARLTYSQAGQNFAKQQLYGPITAGVTYAMSAWFRTSEGCSTAYLLCAYQGNQFVDGVSFPLNSNAASQWQQITGTCTFNEGQIDAGDLFLLVGFSCGANTNANVDTVSFTV